ncbi:MAG TPA: hypothetical protein VEP89_00465, partial [Draconibacterium sp.]|nr:hypothetical protein [Draconibacterium sp.]
MNNNIFNKRVKVITLALESNLKRRSNELNGIALRALLFLASILMVMMFLSSCNTSSPTPVAKISAPGADEVAQQFENPPAEYAISFYWGWDGDVTEEVIERDMDQFKANNVHVVTLEPGYNLPFAYLSEGWFERVKTAVNKAKERDMKVYLVDEGKYPSGFAGGKIISEVPELSMKALMQDSVIELSGGDGIDITLAVEVVSAAAYNKSNGETQI